MIRRLFIETRASFIPKYRKRKMIGYIEQYYPIKKGLIGCEVGVREGFNLSSILKFLDINKIYAVDIDLSTCKVKDKRIVFIEKPSVIASNNVLDESLDFCYIDGDHSYKSVLDDCTCWYPKIKNCGILGGHDFHPNHKGVFKAVNEFVNDYNLELFGYADDWWVIKTNDVIKK